MKNLTRYLALGDFVTAASGNTGAASFEVHVPHSETSATATDDGAVYEVACGASKAFVATEAAQDLPAGFALSPAYPNPFNPQTHFTLAVSEAQRATVAVYDVLGREVAQLFVGRLASDEVRRFTFAAGDLPSGTYLVQVVGETFRAARQVVLLK